MRVLIPHENVPASQEPSGFQDFGEFVNKGVGQGSRRAGKIDIPVGHFPFDNNSIDLISLFVIPVIAELVLNP
jgi:hypothetical protein